MTSKNEVAEAAGLFVYRMSTKDLPSVERLKAGLADCLSVNSQ